MNKPSQAGVLGQKYTQTLQASEYAPLTVLPLAKENHMTHSKMKM